MANELANPIIRDAAEYLLAGVRVRYPDAGPEALKLFEAQVASWEAERLWQGPHAVVVLTTAVGSRWGAAEANLHVMTDGDAGAARWLASQLDAIREATPGGLSCRVSFGRRELLPILSELDLGIAKVGLGGAVSTMRDRLATLSIVGPESLGLRLETVATMEHVRASSALRREYFMSHPEHGWAGSLTEDEQRAIDERVELELQQRLDEANGTDFVLLDGDLVVAAFGLTTVQESPIVGRNASFNICLAPSVHGKGLGTFAYDTMVARAAELGVEYMHGSTSNPGVLRIAAKIGRHVDNWLLRRDRPWVDDELAMSENLLQP